MRRSDKKRKAGKNVIRMDTPTVIAAGTHVKGELHFVGALIIEGEVTGNISCQEEAESMVRILDKGLVRGEVRAPVVVVSGRVVGDIRADRQVELSKSAVVEGNVYYAVLEVEKGAEVNGSLVQGASEQLPARKTPAPSGNKPAVGLAPAPKRPPSIPPKQA